MENKRNQKIFYFSSEDTKRFINGRVDDMASKTRQSTSFIIEGAVMDGLLPKNEEVRSIVQHKLYAADGDGGVWSVLDAVFANNAAGIEWKSKHSNLRPLVEFSINYCLTSSWHKGNSGEIHYLLSQLGSIVEYIENGAKTCIEPHERMMYLSQLEMAKALYKVAKENLKDISYRSHFQLVYDCWDLLSEWSITYRYLACLARMCDFQEDATSRNKLCDIISEISEEW